VIGLVIVLLAGALMGLGVAYQHSQTCSGSLHFVLTHCFSSIRQYLFTIGILVGIPGWYLVRTSLAIGGGMALGFGVGYGVGGHQYSALIGIVCAVVGAAALLRAVPAASSSAA
jgi:hypothetical protein